MHESIIYALLANLCFSTGSIYFTKYSRQYGALKFNTFKAQIALFFFFLSIFFFPMSYFPALEGLTLLAISGILGLAIGDVFLFKAFKTIGASRTLTLFSLRPIFIALITYFIWHEPLKPEDTYPTLFFLMCLFIFASENYKKTKTWDLTGICFAILGVLLDSSGVILTRIVFDNNPLMTSFHANLVRTLFAVLVLAVFCLYKNKSLKTIPLKDISIDYKLIMTPILGTFIALMFFIQAIKTGSLIIISAIGITGPIFASFLESVILKERPSKYQVWALIIFVLGMLLRIYLMN